MMNEASRAQVLAADPGKSTWLSANAGSGKTRVLIDRVARLLLAGVPPQAILCLTYTNAAASEMQNRLFRRLGEWAMKPAEDLAKALSELGVDAVDAEGLAEARRLFARAIETPGGLRIQTIHSFCASLLRRFPLEARVAPQFTEIDERTRSKLISEIVEDMASGQDAGLVSDLARLFSEAGFLAAVERMASMRRQIVPQGKDSIFRAMGLAVQDSADALIRDVTAGIGKTWRDEAAARLLAGSVNDQKLGAQMAAWDLGKPTLQTIADMEGALLAKSGEKAGLPKANMPTAATKNKNPALFEPLLELAEVVSAARPRRLALSAASDAVTLSNFAAAFLPRFSAAKDRRGWLDFDDLIERAERLLTDQDVAAWVLFRLDGGIDHILVDEAQDTSPEQWRVIKLLKQEFTAGEGARGRDRTLFVVGDKKQSIYSFQGADVSAFDMKHREFAAEFTAAELEFQSRELQHSFRSSPAILSLVDAVFADKFPAALGPSVRHIAYRPEHPGKVEVWPVLAPPEKDDAEDDWTDPVDQIAPSAPQVVLSRQIAEYIRAMIDAGTPVFDEKGNARAVHAGDFLILVRRRSGIFPHLIRACKEAQLPIAGADRLKLAEELAVQDLLALLAVLATPEDDLSLAAVLRSPLFGWSEDELFRLAHPRPGYLWEAMRAAGGDAFAVLTDLRDQTDYLRPHDLLDRILTRHKGRVRLLARLGEEAEEAIDALLAQALAYERVEVPSLDGFLAWMQGEDSTIKRQLGEASDKIRVMTVHGAKGLESDIVILPDTADRNARSERTVVLTPVGIPVLTASREDRAEVVADVLNAKAAKEEEESLRLLYVALTRAKSRLVVAASGKCGAESWHQRVCDGMLALGAKADAEGKLTLQVGDWPSVAEAAKATEPDSLPVLPDWARARVAAPQAMRRPIAPSKLGGAKTLAGGGEDEDATARGTAIHALLEHLPSHAEARWEMLANALVPDAALRDDSLGVAARLIRDPQLQVIFGPGSLAEAPVAGHLFGKPAEGTIDRLVITDGGVLAVDYKSNRIVPKTCAETPEAILRQMGAYAALLADIWPGREISTAVLWTETGQLMPMDDRIVREALARSTIDGVGGLDERAVRS